MAQDKDIRTRIKTVTNIAQVTKTMQLISAARMKKAIRLWHESFPYAQAIGELVAQVGGSASLISPLAMPAREVKTIAIIAVAPTKGFVGSLVTKQLGKMYRGVQQLKLSYPAAQLTLITIHKLGLKLGTALGLKTDLHFAKEIAHPEPAAMSAIYKAVTDGFLTGHYHLVYLVYPKFQSATRQEVVFEPLLPIAFGAAATQTTSRPQDFANGVLEPSQRELLDYLLTEYLEKQLAGAILSSNASEHSARMLAMKNATDNALDMSRQLSLSYNKSRQAKITQQVVELASGGAL
jgi:F-type H+-transporting ATPase subunit gamma